MCGGVQVFFHCGTDVFDVGFASTSTTSPMILFGLMLMAVLYSSIGHGGASGYLVVLSLTSFGLMESVWLKQNVWCLNLVVSSIAFYHYRSSGFHDWRLTLPFIVSSVPMVIIGSYMRVDGALYDILLSFVLLFAAWRLIETTESDGSDDYEVPGFRQDVHLIGGGIGLGSGVVGLGGGVFSKSQTLESDFVTMLCRDAAPLRKRATFLGSPLGIMWRCPVSKRHKA